MGLMLSILISCVGVVELLAFYTNVRRLVQTGSTNNGRLDDVGKYYVGELRRERNRLLREISRVEARDINRDKELASLSGCRTEVQSYASELQAIPQTPRNATDICSGDFALTVTDSNGDVQHDPVHGDREPSPYPTYENLAAHRTVCSDLLDAHDVTEVEEEEARSASPKSEDLLRSNFDSQDYWSKQSLRVRRRSKSRSRSRTPEILAQDRLDFEERSRSHSTKVEEVHQDSPPSSADLVEGKYWKRSPSPFQKVLDMYESSTKLDDEATGVTITEIEEEVDSSVLNSVDGLRHQQTNEDTKRSFRKKKRDKKKFRKAPQSDSPQGSFSDHESSIASDVEASKPCETISKEATVAINPAEDSPQSSAEPFWVNR